MIWERLPANSVYLGPPGMDCHQERVVFQDETGFSLYPRLGRGWAKKGQRLRVPTTSQHRQLLNLSGWVEPPLGKKGPIRTAGGKTDGFLKVLQHIWKRLSRYYIWPYVNRASWHKGERVRLFVESHTEIHLEYLLPYQPALNPREHIWRQGRYEATRNVWFYDLDTILQDSNVRCATGHPTKSNN